MAASSWSFYFICYSRFSILAEEEELVIDGTDFEVLVFLVHLSMALAKTL